MSDVRIGILGLGSWARGVHIPNLLQVKGAKLTALCSRTQSNIDAACSQLRDRPAIFSDPDALFESDACDAVLIATPNYLHAAHALKALAAGKHVFCEKPLALTRVDALAVRDAARKSDRVFAVGLELRCADVPLALKAFIEKGTIGQPRFISTQILRNWQSGSSPGWRSDPAKAGGIFFELGCHYTDLYENLLGERTASVHAEGERRRTAAMTDYAAIALRYPSGAVGCLNLCLFASGATDRVDLEIVGDAGRIHAELLSGEVTFWLGDGREERTLDVHRPPGYRYIGFPGSLEILQDFVDCIHESKKTPGVFFGRAPVSGVDAGVSSTLAAIAGERSLRERRPVLVEEDKS